MRMVYQGLKFHPYNVNNLNNLNNNNTNKRKVDDEINKDFVLTRSSCSMAACTGNLFERTNFGWIPSISDFEASYWSRAQNGGLWLVAVQGWMTFYSLSLLQLLSLQSVSIFFIRTIRRCQGWILLYFTPSPFSQCWSPNLLHAANLSITFFLWWMPSFKENSASTLTFVCFNCKSLFHRFPVSASPNISKLVKNTANCFTCFVLLLFSRHFDLNSTFLNSTGKPFLTKTTARIFSSPNPFFEGEKLCRHPHCTSDPVSLSAEEVGAWNSADQQQQRLLSLIPTAPAFNWRCFVASFDFHKSVNPWYHSKSTFWIGCLGDVEPEKVQLWTFPSFPLAFYSSRPHQRPSPVLGSVDNALSILIQVIQNTYKTALRLEGFGKQSAMGRWSSDFRFQIRV